MSFEVPAGPDPVWRSTFLCLQLALAEDARIVGHWLGEVMDGDAEDWPSSGACLRAVGLDLHHLERFVAAARLDLGMAPRTIPSLIKLIEAAIKRAVDLPGRTPAFRETLLLRLPKEPQRAARSLGEVVQGVVAEAQAEREPSRARQGVIADVSYLVAYLREMARFAEESCVSREEERLGRFAGRMADRLEELARSISARQPAAQAGSRTSLGRGA